MRLAPEQIAEFEQQGYLFIPGAFAAEEMASTAGAARRPSNAP